MVQAILFIIETEFRNSEDKDVMVKNKDRGLEFIDSVHYIFVCVQVLSVSDELRGDIPSPHTINCCIFTYLP